MEKKIKDLIKYRSIWMGVAILWIILAHTGFVTNNPLISKIKNIGYGGVDIFIFSSGVGCYYSYSKDRSPINFIKRRIFRLAPTYIPFILIWIIYALNTKMIGYNQIIGNILGIQDFTGNGGSFNWFISGILLCYLMTPFLVPLVEKNSLFQNFIMIGASIVITSCFWNNYYLIIIVTRIPIFILGMLVSKYSEYRIGIKQIFILLISFIVGAMLLSYLYRNYNYDNLLWDYGLHWYPFILMTPFICYAISMVSFLNEKTNITSYINKTVSYLGNSSFELFLSHVFVFEIVNNCKQIKNILPVNLLWLCAIVLSLIVAFLLKWLSNKIKEYIS